MTARLALLRWVARVVRQEWKQHALVVGMVAFGIALATLLLTTSVRAQEPPETFYYGADSTVVVQLNGEWNEAAFDGLQRDFEAVATEHRDVEFVVDGSYLDDLRLTATNPAGALVEPRFDLVNGSWPADGEVALTTKAIDRLQEERDVALVIGDIVELDGSNYVISGVYEDPTNLGDRAALMPPTSLPAWNNVKVLFGPAPTEARSAFAALGVDSSAQARDGAPLITYVENRFERTNKSDSETAFQSYVGATVICLLIAILASAGFTVLAQRRTRQLGMLSAMGAAPRRLGSVMRLTGVVVGVLGGVLGIAIGVVLAVVTTPLIQLTMNHRIQAFDMPWPYLLGMIPLATITALAAAWWPARRIRKASTVEALASTKPAPGRILWPALIAAVLLPLGTLLMIDGAPKNSGGLVVGSVIALVAGGIAAVPVVINLIARLAGGSPLPIRLALRDLNRNRSRSVGTVAAAAIVLAVPFGIASFLASLSANWLDTLPPDTVSIFVNSEGDQSVEALAAVQAVLPDADLGAMRFPVDREATAAMRAQHPEFMSAREVLRLDATVIRESGTRGESVALATPEVLDLMGLSAPPEGTHVIATVSNEIRINGVAVQDVDRQDSISDRFPSILVTEDFPGIDTTDYELGPWFLHNPTAITDQQWDALEDVAEGRDDFVISQRYSLPPFLAIRSAILAIGALIGLAIVAIAVSLNRLESRADTRSLNAIGASPRIAKAIGAANAGTLVVAASLVAIPVSLLALVGLYLNPDEQFTFAIPWLEMASMLVALPLIAATGAFMVTTTKTDRLLR